ncbi:hypothetical protein [Nonomuraea sp. NPDC049784]|uniref:hypothetical protein n=1 Tax=Nonomuraea sp. NPDC049784 TaxID=3154361 RepID=UPI0033D5EBF0
MALVELSVVEQRYRAVIEMLSEVKGADVADRAAGPYADSGRRRGADLRAAALSSAVSAANLLWELGRRGVNRSSL